MRRDEVSLRQVYAEYLTEIGKKRDDFLVLTADTCEGTFASIFAEALPERHITFGIAEQNMISAAAGLSTTGIIPVANTYGVFASMRSVEQFRNSVAYPKFNVKLVVSHLGLDVGPDGPTHQAIEDIAIMRTIPNVVVLSPADPVEMERMLEFMLDYKGPVYLRTGRSKVPQVLPDDYEFTLGYWPTLKEGKDVTIIAVGIMTVMALRAHELLAKEGISAQVLNASTIKPVDEKSMLDRVIPTKAVVTAEDHNIMGGLGSLVSEILCQHHPLPVEFVGIRDRFAESGDAMELFKKYGLSPGSIVEKAKQVMNRR